MMILFILDSLGTGGAERSTADLWYFLRENGIDFHIIALRRRTEGIESEILAEGFKVTFLTEKGLIRQSREIENLIRAHRPSIVHSVLFKSNLRTRIARSRIGFRHIESLVNCSYDVIRLKDPAISKMSFLFYKYLDKLTSRWVDHFIAVTAVVKDHYVKELGIPPDKISVIHRGRQKNEFIENKADTRSKYSNELSVRDDTVIVIHVGRQEFQKGHLVLLEAISKLQSNVVKNCAFVFVGREGNSTSSIRSYLSTHPSSANLIWLGHRHDVQQLLAAADIFVFPSAYEGLGGALIEAQAASLPIVCSDIPVLEEVVLKNQNALMHKDEVQLSAHLSRLIEDPSLRTQMGRIGVENFTAKFSMDKINEKMLGFYKNLIG